MEDCRITTSFYFQKIHGHYHRIGRLPYYYFLLLLRGASGSGEDWNTAVLLLPFYAVSVGIIGAGIGILPYYCFLLLQRQIENMPDEIGRLPYLYFLLLESWAYRAVLDWKTAVFNFLLLADVHGINRLGLEDCRIITSFYLRDAGAPVLTIGRLPYYYFLLLWRPVKLHPVDWKTAVLLLPSTFQSE